MTAAGSFFIFYFGKIEDDKTQHLRPVAGPNILFVKILTKLVLMKFKSCMYFLDTAMRLQKCLGCDPI